MPSQREKIVSAEQEKITRNQAIINENQDIITDLQSATPTAYVPRQMASRQNEVETANRNILASQQLISDMLDATDDSTPIN